MSNGNCSTDGTEMSQAPMRQGQIESWDRWYASLPDDLRRKLSLHDFKRLGDLFKVAFNIPAAPQTEPEVSK
jgi:hypothetical protein